MKSTSFGLAIFIALAWGMVSPIGRYLVGIKHALSPMQLSFLRYLIGFFALLAIHLAKNKASFPALKKFPERRWKLLAGGAIIAVFSIVLFASVELTTASLNGVLLNANALVIALLAFLLLGEKLSRSTISGLVVGFAGTVLIMLPSLIGEGQGDPIGNSLGFLSGVIWAIYTISLQAWFPEEEHSIEVMMIHLGIASIFLAGVTWIIDGGLAVELTLFQAFLVLVISIMSTALAFLAYLLLVNTESPVVAGAVQLVIPAIIVATGYIAFDEKFGLAEWIGTLVLLVGLWLVMRNGNAEIEDQSSIPTEQH